MKLEKWDIYNSSEKKTGKVLTRGEKLSEREFHLVVHIWIKNQANFLIQKRPRHLEWKPGIWATTGGSAIAGEFPVDAAIRETREELGIVFKENDFVLINKETHKNNFTYIYKVNSCVALSDIKFDPNEVENVKYVSMSILKEMIIKGKFINYGDKYFQNVWDSK